MGIMSIAVCGFGQQYPYYSQYFLNPYLYNPATIGNSGYTELNFNYRKQWLGISDAPTTQSFNLQIPGNKSLSYGLNFYNDKTVLLSSSALTLGLAYQATLGDDHFLKFGLSSGVGFNNFDLANVDNPEDPALKGVLDQTTFLSGQFGAFYQYKNLKLGFSLPQLYKYSAIDTSSFQKITIDQLDNYILTASYHLNMGAGGLSVEPYVMYRKSEALPSIIEGGAIMDYKDIFWLGGSYRKDYGGTGFVGFNIKKNLSFSYAYEFAGGQNMSFGNGSHEVNFKFRFGKNKHKKAAPTMLAQSSKPSEQLAPVVVNESKPFSAYKKPVEEESVSESFKKEIDKVEEVAKPEPVSPAVHEEVEESKPVIEEAPEPIEKEETDPNINKPKPEFSPGYYIVLGAFEIYENAVDYTDHLNQKGIKAKYGYVSGRGLYYVYNLKFDNEAQAKSISNNFRKVDEFKDAWVYPVNE